jgi:hypothetical protein
LHQTHAIAAPQDRFFSNLQVLSAQFEKEISVCQITPNIGKACSKITLM